MQWKQKILILILSHIFHLVLASASGSFASIGDGNHHDDVSQRNIFREKRGTDNKNYKISDALNQLTIGKEPSVISNSETYKNSKLSKENRVTRAHQRELQLKELITSPVNRFEAKHLFENGIHKGATDSFDALSDPNRLKTYLVETNRKVYKGGVLPQDAGNQFQKWLERADTDGKPFTIIDADFDLLSRDIKPKYESWKQQELAKHGKLPDKFPDFTTDSQQKVTHLTFQPVRNDKGEIVELSVKMEQLNTKVELGTDGNGKITHFARLDPTDSTLPQNKLREKAQATILPIQDLEKNAKITKEFWKELGLPSNKRNIILNEEAPTFKNFVEQNDADLLKNVIKPTSENTGGDGVEDKDSLKNIGICSSKGRSRRAAGGRSNCAIFLNPNGDVDSLHPKEFIEEYKKADPEGKRKLADLAKNNIEKVEDIDGDDGVQKNKIKKLVELEQVKSHVEQVDKVKNVEQAKPNTKRSFYIMEGGMSPSPAPNATVSTRLGIGKEEAKGSGSTVAATASETHRNQASEGVFSVPTEEPKFHTKIVKVDGAKMCDNLQSNNDSPKQENNLEEGLMSTRNETHRVMGIVMSKSKIEEQRRRRMRCYEMQTMICRNETE
ncbi:unnamed protein product [Orchesella dallaii]|uniref:Uncharacterized protein n=1 Tax=Orchesella dallaii TaxID=48710 RepID=A0ABP1RIX8_9HEXA